MAIFFQILKLGALGKGKQSKKAMRPTQLIECPFHLLKWAERRGKMKTRLYEAQVKDDGKWETIKIKGNPFFSRLEAEKELQAYRQRFPHRITARIRLVK